MKSRTKRELDSFAAAAEPRAMVTGTVSLDELPEAFEAPKARTHQCKVPIAAW